MDEVFIRIRGKQHYLWRAVDQDGNVLDILVQSRRNAAAAGRLFRKLLKGLQYVPRVIVTDKLKSYGTAKRKILPGVEHRQSRYLNNRAEVSHQPTRRRETDEALQVSASCAALSVQLQPDPQPLPTPPSSPYCQPPSRGSRCRVSHMA
jgi:transposase-like protein